MLWTLSGLGCDLSTAEPILSPGAPLRPIAHAAARPSTHKPYRCPPLTAGSYRPIDLPVQPASYESDRGGWRLDINPAFRDGAGPSAMRLSRDGSRRWEKDFPHALRQVVFGDQGSFAGFAYSWKDDKCHLDLAVYDSNGDALSVEQHPLVESRFLHSPDKPWPLGISVNAAERRFVFRTSVERPGERRQLREQWIDFPFDKPGRLSARLATEAEESLREQGDEMPSSRTKPPLPAAREITLRWLSRTRIQVKRPSSDAPIRNVKSFRPTNGGVEYVRKDGAAEYTLVLVGPDGSVAKERRLGLVPGADEAKSVRWLPLSSGAWLVILDLAEPEIKPPKALAYEASWSAPQAFVVEQNKRTLRPLPSFSSRPLARGARLASTKDGGFVVLTDGSRCSEKVCWGGNSELIAYDNEGNRRWAIEEGRREERKL